MYKLVCVLTVSLGSLFATSIATADIIVTLTDAGAAGVTATFSGGTGNWDSTQPNMIFGDAAADSFLADGQGFVFSSGTIPLGVDFGGVTSLNGEDLFYFDLNGGLGLQSLIQFSTSGPVGDPEMSILNGVSITLPGWDFADFTPGTYTGLTGVGGVGGQTITLNVNAIPEPSSFVILSSSLLAGAFWRRRRR